MPGILVRERQRETRDPRTPGEGQEVRVSHCQAEVTWSHRKLEEARRLSDGAFEESTALLTH